MVWLPINCYPPHKRPAWLTRTVALLRSWAEAVASQPIKPPLAPAPASPAVSWREGSWLLHFVSFFLFPESKSPRPHSSLLEDGEGS